MRLTLNVMGEEPIFKKWPRWSLQYKMKFLINIYNNNNNFIAVLYLISTITLLYNKDYILPTYLHIYINKKN